MGEFKLMLGTKLNMTKLGSKLERNLKKKKFFGGGIRHGTYSTAPSKKTYPRLITF